MQASDGGYVSSRASRSSLAACDPSSEPEELPKRESESSEESLSELSSGFSSNTTEGLEEDAAEALEGSVDVPLAAESKTGSVDLWAHLPLKEGQHRITIEVLYSPIA